MFCSNIVLGSKHKLSELCLLPAHVVVRFANDNGVLDCYLSGLLARSNAGQDVDSKFAI